ncbi:hypothetical protein Q8A67_006113 [Cirrhinus molitorella]|uniref:Ig-like domain-containing protein n=1 Tax=Cirrhinus molitorella TaxID=172907 RepID=A0AA88Q7A0_9TELE|nr:hypothetical protein Q8A67_006113 [Cirrhinus molitorella]
MEDGGSRRREAPPSVGVYCVDVIVLEELRSLLLHLCICSADKKSLSAGHSRGCYWWFCCPADPEYKNRAKTFPQEYLKGNFSIKINKLKHTDAGQYICYITHSDEYKTVQLIINGSISTEQENQGETEPERMGLSLSLLLVCIILPVVLFMGIVLIVVFWRKKCSISHRAAGNDVGLANDEFERRAQYNLVKDDNYDEAVGK